MSEEEGDKLEARMKMTRVGQVTWAKPELKKSCGGCVHLVGRRDIKKKGVKMSVGRCALVKAHTRKEGVEFNVVGAIACSMYRGK